VFDFREIVTFFVPGVPRPGGSKRVFLNKKTGKAMVTDSCKKNKDWRSAVANQAMIAYREAPRMDVLRVTFVFFMPRPKGHYGTGRNFNVLKASAPNLHTSQPDVTKLIRSTEDALTGILWRDDSQIAMQEARKVYTGGMPGVRVTLEAIEEKPN